MADTSDTSAHRTDSIGRHVTAEVQSQPAFPIALPRARTIVLAGIAVVLLAAGIWFMSRPPIVQVFTARPQATEVALSVVGRVRPIDVVDVRSPNPGQVIRLFADEGSRVSEGATLAAVLATVEQAQTDAARARETAAQAEAERARLAFRRTQSLAERGFAAVAALDDAQAALRSAEGALTAASADRRAAASRTRELTIRAPMAGAILLRPIDEGQVVSPETTLFQIGSLQGIEIQAEVDETYADSLRPGMPARAALAGSDAQFAAHVTEVSPRVDASTGGRTIKLRPDTPMAIPPGRSVDVTVIVERRADALVVPRAAISEGERGQQLLVVDERGIVRAREVRTLCWPSPNAIVEHGLRAGERVLLDASQAQPGVSVRAEEQDVSSPARAR